MSLVLHVDSQMQFYVNEAYTEILVSACFITRGPICEESGGPHL